MPFRHFSRVHRHPRAGSVAARLTCCAAASFSSMRRTTTRERIIAALGSVFERRKRNATPRLLRLNNKILGTTTVTRRAQRARQDSRERDGRFNFSRRSRAYWQVRSWECRLDAKDRSTTYRTERTSIDTATKTKRVTREFYRHSTALLTTASK